MDCAASDQEQRDVVRHLVKLVGLRSHCEAEVYAVLTKCGVQVLMTDLFGVVGKKFWTGWTCQPGMRPGSPRSAR